MRVAVLDVGSNSVQLLVAEVAQGQWRELAAAESVTRLATGLARADRLESAACARTLRAAGTLATRARALGATRVWAVGTRPFRVAADGPAFAARLERVVGGTIEILSAGREAELGFDGAVTSLGYASGPVLSIDIGGGSTEIVSGYDGRPIEHVSLPLGAVVLTEQCLRHDPPTAGELADLRALVAASVRTAPVMRRYAALTDRHGPIVGSGGTVVTLAAMAHRLDRYRADVVHGSRLGRGRLQAMCAELAARSIAERRAIPGLDPGRAATILAGAVIADELLDAAREHAVAVSDHGLRHAVLRERVRAIGVVLAAAPRADAALPEEGGAVRGPAVSPGEGPHDA